MTDDQLRTLEASACPGAGSCAGMFTANTMATVIETLGMMLPGMASGWIQETIGYKHFFIWIITSTIPAFIITKFIPLDAEFGKKKDNTSK